MNRQKNMLLLIDVQNDFCSPKGSLYVKGAEKDVENMAQFIRKNRKHLDHIICTQDQHQIIDISHPAFWEDKSGNAPKPFTQITPEDIKKGVWKAKFQPDQAEQYVKNLESQGEYPHTIWPEHCIMGTFGAAMDMKVSDAIKDWARDGNFFKVVFKGTNPYTEHFGALRANIPLHDNPETQLNENLLNFMKFFENIFVAGEARTHCVANTIKQLLDYPDLIKKLIILEDCMSNIPGFEDIAKPVFLKAAQIGAKFGKSNAYNLT